MPGWMTRFLLRARATFSRRHDTELRDELQLHLQLLEEHYVAEGMPPARARRLAHQEFGNPTLVQEASHDIFAFRPLEQLVQDLRYACREMRRSLGFTCIAVMSLAVGIGAVTTTFAVVNAFMLRGLPVHAPERLVAFSTSDSPAWASWSYAFFTRLRESPDRLFEVAAASDLNTHRAPAPGSDRPPEVRVSLVSHNYFRVMGVDLVLGGAFSDPNDGASAVAVISDALWDRAFGRAPDVLTRTIDAQGRRYAIVGVTRKGFTGHSVGFPSDAWIPLGMQAGLTPKASGLFEDQPGAGARWLKIMGRLADGVPVERAAITTNLIRQRFLADMARARGEQNPDVARQWKEVISLLKATNGYAPDRARYAKPLMFLSGITALVLLVACANFTNLMLVRAAARRKEFVVRLALGGGRWRLIRQSATECVVLAAMAGLLGLLIASWATAAALKRFAAMVVPVEFAPGVDASVVAFAAGCVAVVIGFGLWPSTRSARAATTTSLQVSASTLGHRGTRSVAGRAMLVAQLVMCTILLIGAGLLLRTVANLRSQELGLDRNVLLVPLAAGGAEGSPGAAAATLQLVRERLAAVPGVQAVGLSGAALLDNTNYWIDGSQRLSTDRGAVLPGAQWTFAAVGPGFFEAVGIPIVAGQGFEDRGRGQAGEGVVINQTLARFLFGEARGVGRQIRLSARGPLQSVLGVVNDARQTSPRDRGIGIIYLPLRSFNQVTLAVRTSVPAAEAVAFIRHQLRSIVGDAAIGQVRTIAQVLDDAIAHERLMSGIALFLAALAIAIGCVGLYALMSYEVARRTHELGIRLALGATSAAIVRMVLGETAWLLTAALVIGTPLGIAASRPLSAQLYGVRNGDPVTLAGVALLLTAVALFATLKPARAASRVDPLSLLRNE